MFFYRHILGWSLDRPKIDLIFGTSWHLAMEYLLLNGPCHENLYGAYSKFIEEWRKSFSEEDDELHKSKNPKSAISALNDYITIYKDDLEKYEVLYTEISATVPIMNNISMTLRMDSILRDKNDGKIYSLDHKTTGLEFNQTYEDMFLMSIATGCYSHCLHCMYGEDDIGGMIYNCTQLKYGSRMGYVSNFKRIYVHRTPEQLLSWLWSTSSRVLRLKDEIEKLETCSENYPTMAAFPYNPKGCYSYGHICEYIDFCNSWQNPLQYINTPPPGFKVEFWDPREDETKVDIKIDNKNTVKIEERR